MLLAAAGPAAAEAPAPGLPAPAQATGDAPSSGTAAGPAATAAELSLEELTQLPVEWVYGASKYDQQVTRAPASISVVTADDIKKFGYRTFADILRSVRGLYANYDRNYAYLGVRGLVRPFDYNSRILVLIDGHRLNDNVYDSALIDTAFPLDVDLIDRVEVIRGPSSSIYGSNAFLGVVNVVTKTGSKIGGIQGSGEVGSQETYKGRATWGHRFAGGLELMLSGTYFDSAGDKRLFYRAFDDPATNNGVTRDADGDTAWQLFGSASLGGFTLTGAYADRKKTVPTGSYGTIFPSDDEKTGDSYGFVDLAYRHRWGDHTTLHARAYYQRYYYWGKFPYDVAAPGDPVDVVMNRDKTIGEEVGTEWLVSHKLLGRHTLLAGVDLRGNIRQYSKGWDQDPRFVYYRVNDSSLTVGVYAQGEFVLLSNLFLNAGVRYDHYESFGGTWNPRAGLIWQPWEGGTMKLLFGRAFRAPNVYEQSYQDVTTPFFRASDLDPETIRTYEAVYEQYLLGQLRVALTGYRYEIDDLISEAPAAGGTGSTFKNVAGVTAHGLEVEAEARLAGGWRVRGSYAIQRTEDDTTNDRVPASPTHLAKLNLIAPLWREKVFAGLELQYNSAVRTVQDASVGDFLLTNLTLYAQKLLPGLEISASVYNLFDVDYSHPASVEHLQKEIKQDGRTFRLKLTYTF